VRAIVGLAQGLDLRVVAEGIETKEQAEALRALGCAYGQGYRFARPLTADQVMASLAGEAVKARSAG
jgi:EAL domain-containing protein (putative c-di-GMP-specific phosphodiesterase class I)